MNLAPIINEDLAQLEQTLLARIATLRKQVASKQKTIDDRVSELQKAATEDMAFISKRLVSLRDTVNRFSAEIQKAQKNPRFDASMREYLREVEESLHLQLDGLGGPFSGFFRGDQQKDADASSQGTENDDPFKPKGEEESDNTSGSTAEKNGQADEKLFSDNGPDFFDEEFIQMMREFERQERLRDPFSQESLEALRQTPDDPELRKLYLHLSKQAHPDFARTPEEATQRTQLMQKLSHAYRTRDFAALLTIQEVVSEGGFSTLQASTETITEERITALRSTVEKLEAQLKALKKHSNRMSRSSTGKMLKHRREYGVTIHDDLFDVSVQLQELIESVAQLIQRAAAGSLKMGTLRKRCDEIICPDEDDMDIDEELDLLMEMLLLGEIESAQPRRGRGRKRR